MRRCSEIASDIDLVASTSEPESVLNWFTTLPHVAGVALREERMARVRLHDSILADLHVVPEEQFASALHHFTGSAAYATAIRYRALKMGFRINEFGIFRPPVGEIPPKVTKKTAEKYDESVTGHRLDTPTEADVFRALGLHFITPELREGGDEIGAAEYNELPKLVTLDDYCGVIHCHSTWSDGLSSIRDLALAARDRWHLQYIAICDHSEAAYYARGIKKPEIPAQQAEIDELNAELGSEKFRILKSCECDILQDGSLDYPDDILATMDLVVASVHSRFSMSGEEMTQRIMKAMENPYMTIMGHVSGRLLLSRDPYQFDIEAVLRQAAATGTIMEINADPHRLDLDWRYCRRAKEMGISFAINPDAHSSPAIACIQFGINTARKGWLTSSDVVNCLPLTDLLARAAAIRDRKLKLRATK